MKLLLALHQILFNALFLRNVDGSSEKGDRLIIHVPDHHHVQVHPDEAPVTFFQQDLLVFNRTIVFEKIHDPPALTRVIIEVI